MANWESEIREAILRYERIGYKAKVIKFEAKMTSLTGEEK